jgi:2-oxoglutarate dehydrogenase E1 component
MSRQAQNAQFLQTSFLSGTNAAYIEEMQAQYEANPGSVGDEWRHFFESLKEERATMSAPADPSWGTPLENLASNGDLVSALTSDWGGVESRVRTRIAEQAQSYGVEMSPVASMRATQDSIRALMLIRAYRMMGHLVADLDPLKLDARPVHKELKPETYGFTDADLDRPIFLDRVLGLDTATMRQIVKILRRTYCRQIGYQYAHI